MDARISRRKIAAYVVDQLDGGRTQPGILAEVAAYLLASHRQREAVLVVRAIEDELARRGTVVARVTTARPLTAELKAAIKTLVSAREIQFSETVDPRIIGGVRIETPGEILDATIANRLLALRRAKV